jgi:hypothetical protein
MNLEPKAGFDWAKVTWGRPDTSGTAGQTSRFVPLSRFVCWAWTYPNR